VGPALQARAQIGPQESERAMPDLLFALVSIVTFAALIAFVYACARL
jgi:hypothetical protein